MTLDLDSRNRAIVVLTCVDGALREAASGSCAASRAPLRALTALGVPVILVSHHAAAEMIALQRDLGVSEPFIAEHGRALHIPRGYFIRLPSLVGRTGDWEVIEFAPPSIEEAIDMLMWLYRVSGDSPLLIGVGVSPDDQPMLHHVDVPVVVRSATVDQRRLRQHFPEAYVSQSPGPAGWREAILGPDTLDPPCSTAATG
jgi:predicted mannosyl-3-phosphoglycerate phosphatase (HAD superfamily)